MASADLTALLSPGLGGCHWERDHPEAAEVTQSPVLSLVQLPLKAPLDQKQSSIVTDKLIQAALEYIGSIPGCTSIWAGSILESPGHMICLIQWRSRTAWHAFQRSAGFGLLLGILDSEPINRVLPIQLQQLAAERTIVEIISFTFSENISDETKGIFEASLAQKLTENTPNRPVSTCGGWLERDVPRYNPKGSNKVRLDAERALAALQPSISLSLLEWNQDEYYTTADTVAESFVDSDALAQDFSKHFKVTISKASIRLSSYRTNISEGPRVTGITPTSTESLLKYPVNRRYSPEKTVLRNYDFVAVQSINEVHSRQREFSVPYGHCWPMGDLNQYSLPQLATVPSYYNRAAGIFDTLLLHFELDDFSQLDNMTTLVGKRFQALRNLLQKETGCSVVRWCCDQESRGLVSVIICWETLEWRSASSEAFQQVISEYTLGQYFIQPPTIQTFPSFSPLVQDGWIEIITFQVPTPSVDKQLFEHAFYSFQTTTLPGGAGMNLKMCVDTPFSGGWEIPICLPFDPEKARFTTVFHWVSPQAKARWYADFAEGVARSYERLGWMIDLLQILTVGVESRFLKVMPKDD